jgi:hypothetical protein
VNLLAAEPMVSPWIAVPLAFAGMVLAAAYTLGIQRDDVPPARRKIRTALGLLHIFILGALAFGVSIVTVEDKKTAAVCWLLVIGLVGVSVLLAVADAAVTLKLAVRERREEAKRAADALAQAVVKARRERDEAARSKGPAA